MDRNIQTFIGCDKSYEESNITLFGAPFDGTTSYRPGARFGPAAIRNESYSIETYSPYCDRDLSELNVFDGGDMEFAFGNTERILNDIEDHVNKLLSDNKIPVMLGGEHLVTLGAMRAVIKRYNDVRVIHFDAHADLRDDYLGEKLSHATVMRRVHELVGDGRIFQFGIRSGDKPEFDFARDHVSMNRFNFDGLDKVTAGLSGKPVYLTIGLDVLDSSVLAGTGTPEAGGVTFTELLEAIKALSGMNIIGCDIVELAPNYDLSGASTSLACKLLREILLHMF